MKAKFPAPLAKGDTIALLAPASPLASDKDPGEVAKAAETFGLRVKQYPSLRLRQDYTAGTPKQRAADMQKAFADPRIAAISCLRGGYGTAHLLPHLDLAAIKASRKLLIGYSDLTMLLNPLATVCGMVSLHAPTMNFFLRDDEATRVSHAALEKFLFELPKTLSYRELCGPHFKPERITKGVGEGTLVGGNLSVFVTLLGTPWEPKGKDLILFLEEIGEKPYRVDRFITHLVQSGFMNRVRGVALGQFSDCLPTGGDVDSVSTVLARLLKPLGIPVLAGLPIGHDRPSFPLPIGARARLDATKGDLQILGV